MVRATDVAPRHEPVCAADGDNWPCDSAPEPTPGLREALRQAHAELEDAREWLASRAEAPEVQERLTLARNALVPFLAASPAPEPGELESAYQIALSQIRHDGETIKRLDAALRVATHSPHDQDGEPNEGFPVCSVCGAIQTAPEPTGLDADVATVVRRSSPWANCQRKAAFRAECSEVDPGRPQDWCDFCQAHARLAARLTGEGS